jgi:hypothetical protein
MTPMMRRSSVYIVRTWIETLGDSSVELRGMVRNVQSGETRYFRDWEALVAFVKDHTDDPPDESIGELTDEPLSNPGDDAERSICPPDSTTQRDGPNSPTRPTPN